MAAAYLDRAFLQAARTIEPTSVLLLNAEPIRRLTKTDIALSSNVAR